MNPVQPKDVAKETTRKNFAFLYMRIRRACLAKQNNEDIMIVWVVLKSNTKKIKQAMIEVDRPIYRGKVQ